MGREWPIVKWDDVLSIQNGRNQKGVENPQGRFPIYGSGGIMGYADQYLCEAGTTIVGRKGSINKPIFVDEPFWNVDTAFGLIPGKDLHNKFLFYFCLTFDFLKLNKATTLPSLTKTDLLKIEIPLPPLSEQKRIASLLDTADALRQQNKALIAQYNQLAQSLFLEMFGDPVRNEKGWEVKTLGEVADVLTGHPFKSAEYVNDESQVKLCGGLIISPSSIEWEKANHYPIEKITGLERYRLLVGDIVLAMDRPWINSGLKVAAITKHDPESLLVQRTARIRSFGVDRHYLFKCILDKSFEVHTKLTETTVPHLSPKDISTFPIPLPPLPLQEKFASLIENIEGQKSAAESALRESEALFQRLLQDSFV